MTSDTTARRADPGLAPALIAGFNGAIVGFASSVAVLIAAAQSLGATDRETTSWLTAICLVKLIAMLVLTLKHRMPLVVAWSTAGAALIATTPIVGGMPAAVGAFVIVGALTVLTAFVRPLENAIRKIPASIASTMLAGILFRFVSETFIALPKAPWIVLPMLVTFILTRLIAPMLATLAALAVGMIAVAMLGQIPSGLFAFRAPDLVWIAPIFTVEAVVSLALPLYLVTMASQNLAGAAVLKSAGYEAPMRDALTVTGLGSIFGALFGAHTVGLAAISAAICMGPDVHPDKSKRWPAAISNALTYVVFTMIAGSVVAWLAGLPKAFIAAFAGLALIASFASAAASALEKPDERFPAAITFAVAAAGFTLFGIGSAFWGLVAGLAVYALDRAAAHVKSAR